MKRVTVFFVLAISTVLVVCTMVGCASWQSPSESEAHAAKETHGVSEQSQGELIDELNQAILNVPQCKSLTVTEEMTSTFYEDGKNEDIKEVSIYKFDQSGDKIKTSVEVDSSGVKLAYYTDGDAAVFVTDGPVYAGTTEQFGLDHAKGLMPFLENSIGKPDVFLNCAASVEKTEGRGLVIYSLTLDPKKYIESDEALRTLAKYGSPVKEAYVTFGFEGDGRIVSIDKKLVYEKSTSVWNLVLSKHDKTVVSPMPEATSTYEQMEEDEERKLEEIFGDEDVAEGTVAAK
ncbi:MAG: hypothetical protein IKG21_01210 [Atopobiaceae bacterium]|nr:hypothetical protein [Atopobiaceae bacterium]